jgi:hypothetical protein
VSSCSGDFVTPITEVPDRAQLTEQTDPFLFTGQVALCKFAPDQTTATWGDFEISASPDVGTFPLGTEFRLDAGTVNWGDECSIVSAPTAEVEGNVILTITEVGMPAGMETELIVVFQAGEPMQGFDNTNTDDITVRSAHGAYVYFKNRGEPEADPPTGETATGAGFPWSATQGAPNNWFMYTPWANTSGHLGISGGTTLIAGQHHVAGTITGTRTNGGDGQTTITITLNSSFTFDGAVGNVKSTR